MAVLHQMGHDSVNLLDEPCLSSYSGAIISPVNIDEGKTINLITKFKSDRFEMIFDPQLFFPRNCRDKLTNWSYYPSDVDTVDISQSHWWHTLNDKLVELAERLQPSSICSPVVVPRVFSDDYYRITVDTGNDLFSKLSSKNVNTIQTVLLDFNSIGSDSRAYAVSSIISRTKADRVYIIINSGVEPRRELSDAESLSGCIDFIDSLEQAGIKTIVGYASNDLILWKFAKATHCATGKFFNLRRFAQKRWEEPQRGGGAIPYWIENSLMAFLRDADFSRLNKQKLIPDESLSSVSAQSIIKHWEKKPGVSWLALSWRHYLQWFSEFDEHYPFSFQNADEFLTQIEQNWQKVNNSGILMDEPQNDGSWVRKWRQAIRGSQLWRSGQH